VIRNISKRTDFKAAIPLEIPLILIIETTNICNLKCRFCPTTIPSHGQYVHAAPRTMSFEEFKFVADMAKCEFQQVKTLQLYNFGEPLICKDICKMIKYAKKIELGKEIRIFTNGALLTPKLSLELADAFSGKGNAIIQFSIEHISDNGYKEVCNANVSYDKLLANISYFYTNLNHDNAYVVCKLINDAVTAEDAEKFKKDFAKCGDDIHVEQLEDKTEKPMRKTGDGITTYDGHKSYVKKVCINPFYILSVQSDLTVKACTADIFRLNTIGDLHNETLKEIWNSEKLFNLRKQHLLGKTNEICSYCTYFQHQIDDIDDAAEKILYRLERQKLINGT
jgi:radical SAM protein with 4Fe4S-binding SPASM domain